MHKFKKLPFVDKFKINKKVTFSMNVKNLTLEKYFKLIQKYYRHLKLANLSNKNTLTNSYNLTRHTIYKLK